MDEKLAALQALSTIIATLEEQFLPYLELTIKRLDSMVVYPHDDIREQVFICFEGTKSLPFLFAIRHLCLSNLNHLPTCLSFSLRMSGVHACLNPYMLVDRNPEDAGNRFPVLPEGPKVHCGRRHSLA